MELFGASKTKLSRVVKFASEEGKSVPLRTFETAVAEGTTTTAPSGLTQAKAVREVMDDMSNGLMNPRLMNSKMRRLKFRVETGGRTSTNILKNDITLRADAPRREIAHEFGHHIESKNREVKRRMAEWRNARSDARRQSIPSEQFTRESKLIDEAWGPGTKNGDFFDSYVGKAYFSGDTEVLSMAIEGLYNVDRLKLMLKLDPEHFQLLWATLRGF